MSKPDAKKNVGLWLACGGLLILATHHLLFVYEPTLTMDNLVLLGGALLGYLGTAIGIWLSINRRSRGPAQSEGRIDRSDYREDFTASEQPAITEYSDTGRRMTAGFLSWCEQQLHDDQPWKSFDQLVREMLSEHSGAVRVRCYQVLPGDQQLRGLSQSGGDSASQCARSGILGHVATGGREYFSTDPAHGDLIDQLAADDKEPWEWVFPIRADGCTVGLVAVGKLSSIAALSHERRQEILSLITLFWAHVSCLERLRQAEKTDKGSGLLTRGDFFASGAQALAGSYAENEPVVVVVLALEGLRHLDDVGRWTDRDKLVENIGVLIKRRIRTDDIIGRFSDDRFVLLLRRLDSSLGRLIAEKIQSTAREQIAQLGDVGADLRVRVGLIGSGFLKEPLEKLLVSAFDTIELARKQGLDVYCDLSAAQPEKSSAPAVAAPADSQARVES